MALPLFIVSFCGLLAMVSVGLRTRPMYDDTPASESVDTFAVDHAVRAGLADTSNFAIVGGAVKCRKCGARLARRGADATYFECEGKDRHRVE